VIVRNLLAEVGDREASRRTEQPALDDPDERLHVHRVATAGEAGAGHRRYERLVHRGEEAEGDGCEDDRGLHELRRGRHRPVDVDDLEGNTPQERLARGVRIFGLTLRPRVGNRE
jgi:hypothetical protein